MILLPNCFITSPQIWNSLKRNNDRCQNGRKIGRGQNHTRNWNNKKPKNITSETAPILCLKQKECQGSRNNCPNNWSYNQYKKNVPIYDGCTYEEMCLKIIYEFSVLIKPYPEMTTNANTSNTAKSFCNCIRGAKLSFTIFW